ncbi:MAG: 2-amino-4-hydroxy-6-hydroxymethyldihydropteridine diphosphokinase [Dokdonella sp.]
MERVYLSIGSNLQPNQHISAALAELRDHFSNVEVSPFYRSKAVGFDGPDFINAAIVLDTDWEPDRLNTWLHALEDRQGRQRDQPRYSSRTLDIDIVLFGDRVLTGAGNLEVPRNELQYAFVLRPLLDLAPNLHNPATGERLDQLWPTADANSIHQILGS